MPQSFPVDLDARLRVVLLELQARVTALEARAVVLDSGVYVCNRSGVIDPSWTSGDPHVTLDGQSALTGPYPVLSSYTVTAGAHVLLLPLGQSYIVAGTFS